MIKYSEKRTVSLVIEAITCNQCGQDVNDNAVFCGNYFQGRYIGGYSSKIGDGTSLSFELCEPCLKGLVAGFKKPPLTEDVVDMEVGSGP